MTAISPEDRQLVQAAVEARANAYAPHSGFMVGAALLTNDGKVYTGCNVESDAYSPTICAERVALGSAIAAGEKPGSFKAVAVVCGSRPCSPCGVCRQLLFELGGPDLRVIMASAPDGEDTIVWTAGELLPLGFRLKDFE